VRFRLRLPGVGRIVNKLVKPRPTAVDGNRITGAECAKRIFGKLLPLCRGKHEAGFYVVVDDPCLYSLAAGIYFDRYLLDLVAFKDNYASIGVCDYFAAGQGG